MSILLQVNKKNNFLFHNYVTLQYLNNVLSCCCNYTVFFLLQLDWQQISAIRKSAVHKFIDWTVCQISPQCKTICYFVHIRPPAIL